MEGVKERVITMMIITKGWDIREKERERERERYLENEFFSRTNYYYTHCNQRASYYYDSWCVVIVKDKEWQEKKHHSLKLILRLS
jgi:hypothetical protein